MKNLIFLLFVIGTIFVISCEKEILQNEQKVEKVTLQSFQKLADKYDSHIQNPNTKVSDKTKKIVKEDIEGAGTGALMGSAFGPWGALIGGLIVGGLNSWAASANGGSLTDDNNNFSWIYENNYNPETTYSSNPSNPYEEVGIKHNQLLIYLAEGLQNNELENPTNKTELYQYLLPFMEKNYPESYGFINSDECFELVSNGLKESLENVISSEAYDIYQLYINTSSNIDSPEIYANFTIAYETLVLNSTLNNGDKEALLAALAVSRYSNSYWTAVFEN